MELHSGHFTLVVLCLATFSALVTADQDFDTARQKINQAKPNISYNDFCSELKSGEDKIACRIKGVKTVGFLVCKTPELGELKCSQVIRNEISNIETAREWNVKTVTISPPPVDNVTCGSTSDLTCSGFLEKWIDPEEGLFQHVRDHIHNNTIDQLIIVVRGYTSSGLPQTADDLRKIKTFMTLDPTEDKYRQICDLQGFFLKIGGFLVADVPKIENTTLTGKAGECYDGEPTTQEVLSALDRMIASFSGSTTGSSNAPNGGPIWRSGPFIKEAILLTGLQIFVIITVNRI